MIDWILTSLIGGSIRMGEALLSCAPTLLVGLLVAAIFRFYLGTEGTRRLFGGSSLRALPQSWAIGMLLPVCSIGVLPILFEMRRAGLKAGAMSAFALSAPLFNPLSLLYGITLSRPYVILMFAFGSLIVVTVVGLIWDLFSKRASLNDQPQSESESHLVESVIGVRRLIAMVCYSCRQLVGPAGVWAVIASLGMLLLAAALPWGALGHAMGRDDWMAPARMMLVAIPAYATPMLAMGQLGLMFQHANSPGAAFILLVIGAGVNFGTIAWMSREYGFRSVIVWLACLATIVVAISYSVNRPLIPPGVTPASHTHAFDVYTNPLHVLDSDSGAFARRKLAEKFGVVEQVCFSIFAFMAVLGVLFRAFGVSDVSLARGGSKNDSQSSDAETERTPNADDALKFDRVVSPQVVGGTMIAGLVALSIVMCYGFYPSPEECIKEIRFIRADALSAALSGDTEHAEFWIPRWDEWSRRTEVGAFLRRGQVTPYQRMQGFLLRSKLDLLEHELEHEHDDPDAIRDLVNDLMATDARWLKAFREPYEPGNEAATSD